MAITGASLMQRRFAVEREWFEEDKAENIRRKKEAEARKKNKGAKGTAKAIADIKYQPKISDRDLLRFAKVQRVVLKHQLASLEASGALADQDGASKYRDEEEENEYPDEDLQQRQMEDAVEEQMMQQLRMLQQQDKQKEEEQKYQDNATVHKDSSNLGGSEALTSDISEEKSVYEGKYEQVESREEAAPSPLSAEPNRIEVQEEKTEPEHGEPGEGTKYDEVTDIDREFAEMQQQILSETKAQDPEEHPSAHNFLICCFILRKFEVGRTQRCCKRHQNRVSICLPPRKQIRHRR